MSGCMEDTSLRIASFSSDRLDGPDRYTRDFKYPHNQKSAGVKSGDRGGHGYLQRLLTILSSPNVCIRNALTGIRRRILRTDDGGKPNHLAASRALLVPEAASDAIASISTAMQGARASFKHGHPARARSSSFPVSSKRLASFKRPAGVKGPFPLFTFF
ncbi:uncharacterized protein TNCV_4631121 [Trichonephila clavipes]|nr:uncharacterized protein TNCV_4631121 [Trichonephila clavipes]